MWSSAPTKRWRNVPIHYSLFTITYYFLIGVRGKQKKTEDLKIFGLGPSVEIRTRGLLNPIEEIQNSLRELF